MQTPQALFAILQDRGINISLLDNEGEHQNEPIYFYERNPAGRGLDFNDYPEQKADFLRYAVQLNCINPIRDITKNLLPPLEEIARGISIQLRDVIKPGNQSRRDMDTALTESGTEQDWFPETKETCEHYLGLNNHLGADGAMSPGRVQDPEGAKKITLSYNTPAGAIAAITKRRFLITCYTEHDTSRLRLDPALTSGTTAGARSGAKKILIYDSYMHPLSALDPVNCGPGTTPRDKTTWVGNTLKVMEHFDPIPLPEEEAPPNTEEMDTNEQARVDPQHRATCINTEPHAWQAIPKRHGKATPSSSANPQGRASEGATSPERRAYSAQTEHNKVKNKFNANKFQPLMEENNETWGRQRQSQRGLSLRCLKL